MKKLILIAITIIAAAAIKAQPQQIYIDSIVVNTADVVAADTIIPFPIQQLGSATIDVEYTGLDAADATIDILIANVDGWWKSLSVSPLPYTLDPATALDTLTGKSVTGFILGTVNSPYSALRIKKGTVTEGYIRAVRILVVEQKRGYPWPR